MKVEYIEIGDTLRLIPENAFERKFLVDWLNRTKVEVSDIMRQETSYIRGSRLEIGEINEDVHICLG